MKPDIFKNSKPYDNLTIGPLVKDVDKLIEYGSKDNANMYHNPETCHKYVADAVMKPYAMLKMLPPEVAESHINGYIHVHDLEYLGARPLNCMQHDARAVIKYGLKVDGSGLHSSVAGPPHRMSVLINQLGQLLGAGQCNMSGGQSIPMLNTFLAPFAEQMLYGDIKQSMQSLIYNLNQAYVSRGGQTIFSSVNLDFNIPKWIKNEPAYGPGGKEVGVYGDYEFEAEQILLAFTEAMNDGDYCGKPFLFPNTVYRVEGVPPKDLLDKVCELSAKFSIPYFTKALNDEEYHNVMGCRTRLNSNWTGDPDADCLRTGNLAYVSLNLPRYALKGRFYEQLDRAMDTAKEVLLFRKEHAIKLMDKHNMMPFLSQEIDDEPYYRIDNATLSFGVVGLSDAIKVLTGTGLDNPENQKLGKEIMGHINNYAYYANKETGDRWTVIGSPAESTAHRFAMEDRRKYRARAPVHGESGAYYYTNSTHVPVDADVDIIQKIKLEQPFHIMTSGGAIFHGFIGDNFIEPESVCNLTNKLIENSTLGFWTLTNAYSFCISEHKLLNGIHETCTDCGSETEVYDRITGYLQRVSGWNKGKQAEFKDRKRF